jgi:adenylate cyclase
MKSKKHSKNIAAPVITGLVFIAVLGLHFLGVFQYLEYKTYDLRVSLLAAYSRPSDDIIVILLDQASLDWGQEKRGWSWPWPRAAYGEIVDYMNTGNAAAIAFDVIFSEPSVYGAGDDESFVKASADFGKVVQLVFINSISGSAAWLGPEKPFLLYSGPDTELFNAGTDTGRKAQFPIPGLRDAAGAIGSVTGSPDPDDVIRRVRLSTPFDGRNVPELAAAALVLGGQEPELRYDGKMKMFRWGKYNIPVDRNGQILLHFRGNLSRYIPYSASEILESAENYNQGGKPLLPPEDFTGKYVFFGFNAPGLYDIFNTPISSLYPGVGVHITVLDNLLQGDFIHESPQWVNILIILAAVVISALITLFSNRIPLTVGGTLLVIAVVIGVGINAYYFANLWLPMVAPLAGIFAALITGTLYNFATEGRQKRFIKSAFSRYLAPSVIEQLIADPSKLNLGGEKREMTAIFTDIQRFSSISESLQKEYLEDGPRVLVNLLNLYLTEMSNIILANQGTIDKYEGDAIIAFFGAPIWTDKHAILACRSAIQMKKREAELRGEIMKADGPFYRPLSALIESGTIRPDRPLYTRVGINTGDMVVGNMGTPDKMDYTIMGNAVNLAARLEGVNKQYDTSGILISEYTKEKIGDEFVIRGLSRVRVVGINTPLRLYELLEMRETAAPETLEMTAAWERALQAYEERDFPGAKNIFASILRQNGQDRVAKLYVDRCEKNIAAPLTPEKWDSGVDNLTEK